MRLDLFMSEEVTLTIDGRPQVCRVREMPYAWFRGMQKDVTENKIDHQESAALLVGFSLIMPDGEPFLWPDGWQGRTGNADPYSVPGSVMTKVLPIASRVNGLTGNGADPVDAVDAEKKD